MRMMRTIIDPADRGEVLRAGFDRQWIVFFGMVADGLEDDDPLGGNPEGGHFTRRTVFALTLNSEAISATDLCS